MGKKLNPILREVLIPPLHSPIRKVPRFEIKRGVSALAACIVRAQAEKDDQYLERFVQEVSDCVYVIKNDNPQNNDALEVLCWTLEQLGQKVRS